MQPDTRPAPPDTILDENDPLQPRSPFSFFRESLGGGFDREGKHLIAAWTAFIVLTSGAWAFHLRHTAGWSALPAHWGERLTARDLFEFFENGGLKHDVLGLFTPWVAALTLVWALWAGWRMQARTVDLEPRLGPWFVGALETLFIGLGPLMIPAWVGGTILSKLAATGIQGLGWLQLGLGSLFKASYVSALMLQWWFCRLDRTAANGTGFWRHLGHSFLRVWIHPVQWFLLLFAGAALRTTLGFGVLLLAWRWGGGSAGRVWLILALQATAAAASAWSIGFLLRLSARFWRQDRRVRQARLEIEAAVLSPLSEPSFES